MSRRFLITAAGLALLMTGDLVCAGCPKVSMAGGDSKEAGLCAWRCKGLQQPAFRRQCRDKA